MKLTDEQREKIRKLVYAPQKDLGRGLMVQFVSTRDAARLLLASEQAWKEEYKEEKAAHNEHAAELVQLEKRFNQAMEVLKWYAENEYRSGGRAKDFLKSLSQGIETNEST